jgi:HlyD family secretion protein
MRKRLFIVLLAAIIGAAGYFASLRFRTTTSSEDGSLTLYGTIDLRDANLAFNEQERIIEVLVEEGEQVAAGQLLARLNPDRLNAAIEQTRANILAQQQQVDKLSAGNRPQEIDQAAAEVEAARIRLASAEQILARVSTTSGSGASSQQELDDAATAVNLAKAQLKSLDNKLDLLREGPRQEDLATARHQLEALEASLQQLMVRFGELTLLAPASGIIQNRILEPGEMAGPTRPVMTLALNEPKWVRAYLPEPQLGRVAAGMAAEVLSDTFPDQPVEGWVGFISPVAEFTPRTVQTEDLRTRLVYETRVYVRDPDNRLRLGMPVTVRLIDPISRGNTVSSASQHKPTAK